MTPEKLKQALADLRQLLKDGDAREQQYQDWFERHPVVFTAYGFRRVLPQPRLLTSASEGSFPDFLVEDLTGKWQVVELKRPDTPVLKPPGRRQTFYAEFEQYVAQCREYSRFFADREHREAFNTAHGVSVQESVWVRLLLDHVIPVT